MEELEFQLSFQLKSMFFLQQYAVIVKVIEIHWVETYRCIIGYFKEGWEVSYI